MKDVVGEGEGEHKEEGRWGYVPLGEHDRRDGMGEEEDGTAARTGSLSLWRANCILPP